MVTRKSIISRDSVVTTYRRGRQCNFSVSSFLIFVYQK